MKKMCVSKKNFARTSLKSDREVRAMRARRELRLRRETDQSRGALRSENR
jgi:hypothetical protein